MIRLKKQKTTTNKQTNKQKTSQLIHCLLYNA